MIEIFSSTWRHLGYGMRALLLRRVDPAQMRAVGPEPVLIGLLGIVATVVGDLWKADGIELSAWGVSAELATTTVLLAVILLMRPRQRGVDVASLIAVIFASGLFLVPVSSAVEWVSSNVGDDQFIAALASYGGTVAVFVWYLAAIWLLGRRSTDVKPLRFGFGMVLAVIVGSYLLPGTPILKYSREHSAGLLQSAFNLVKRAPKRGPLDAAYPMIDSEATFARQAQLIDSQLDGLAPSRPGVGEVYFVGMATYAMQDVFKREVTSAREIMDERFGTRGHSVVMFNHRDTIETLPLATILNLERVLWRLAQRMDNERDVLVLYITTHGSEGSMSVSFPGLMLNDLTPQRLSAVLARTGIRNKVVLLSACHAGSFVPGVAAAETLVMAAARADRSSFGCSNERDWTYFGDALFNHAFRQTHSITGAFERAKALVGEWETAQKLSPASEPQIGGGEAIAVALERVEKRLAGK